MKNRILTLILSIFIISFTSCEEEEPTPEVTISAKYISYTYVDFTVQLSDVFIGTNFPGATIYYDTLPYLNESSPSQGKGFEGDFFTLTLLGLEMNQAYYVKIVAEGVASQVIKVQTDSISFSCSVNEGYLVGANSSSKQYHTEPPYWSGETYFDQDEYSYMNCELEGDFRKIEILKPEFPGFTDGIYLTYNSQYQSGISSTEGVAVIRLTDNNQLTYTATSAHAIKFAYFPGWIDEFFVTFCDVLFVTETGETVVLSGNLRGRYDP